MNAWLHVSRGDTPLLLSMPHSGTGLAGLEPRLVSPWRARKDTDWHIPELYAFAESLGATLVRTSISRTVIDVNRDPCGLSLYPGQATTALCPTTTFDGEPLYLDGQEPAATEVAQRRHDYFEPYHAALQQETARLLDLHPRVVLYDCHSIRSSIPRLFEGELPQFNIGTNDGRSCDARLAAAVHEACAASPFSHVLNGRFKGGYITRHFGDPMWGLHAVQMELACRGYLREPPGAATEADWPVPFDPHHARGVQEVLRRVLQGCLDFAALPLRAA